MDKKTLAILKYIAEHEPVNEAAILEKFGERASFSLGYLYKNGYAFSDDEWGNMSYSASCEGLAFLEEKPGKTFDHWLTRAITIYGAITATAAIVLEIVLYFLQNTPTN